MDRVSKVPLLGSRLDVHDRKQFEIKLEYQPSGQDAKARYHLEFFLFVPYSLKVDAGSYPRSDFYRDIHNYVRLKTPIFAFEELLTATHSPLVLLEERVQLGQIQPETELVYDAKMLSCVLRGVLRRFSRDVAVACARIAKGGAADSVQPSLSGVVGETLDGTVKLLERFRRSAKLLSKMEVSERTRASMRLVDEYLSLSVEQFFRKALADMDKLPRTGAFLELRRKLLGHVLADEVYRRDNQLKSVLAPTGDNEEYMHRVGFLKKFCMNILFLEVFREQRRQGWEEVLFAAAAGVAMAFATAVALFAQAKFPQASLNFFLIIVVGYMMKDRIKEGLRRFFSSFAARMLFDRTTRILDPVTQRRVGTCKEKVDYGVAANVPAQVEKLRQVDDFVTVSRGELSEGVIRYQKEIELETKLLGDLGGGLVSGVTDIIRLNVGRLLRDMDDPEYALEYIDRDDFSVGRIRGAKSYQVDIAFRFSVDDAEIQRTEVQLVRLVLDRNGIKRMLRYESTPEPILAPSPTALERTETPDEAIPVAVPLERR